MKHFQYKHSNKPLHHFKCSILYMSSSWYRLVRIFKHCSRSSFIRCRTVGISRCANAIFHQRWERVSKFRLERFGTHFGTRSERVRNAFGTRSERKWNANGTRSERVPDAFRTQMERERSVRLFLSSTVPNIFPRPTKNVIFSNIS